MCETKACGSSCLILPSAATAVTGMAYVVAAALAFRFLEAAAPVALLLLRWLLFTTGVAAAAAGGAGTLWWLRRRRGRPVRSRRVDRGVGLTVAGTTLPLAIACGVPWFSPVVALVALGLAGASVRGLQASVRLSVRYWPAMTARPALPATMVRRELPAAAPLALAPGTVRGTVLQDVKEA